MEETGLRNGAHGADKFGFKGLKAVHWNLTEPALYEYAIARGEAQIVQGGALAAETGVHTGRSPKDKFIVCDSGTEKTVWWDKNGKLTPEQFDLLLKDFIAHAKGRQLFAQDLYGGADAKYRIKARIFTELAWHSLFIRSLLIRPERSELPNYVPDFTILCLPSFKADPKRHGVRTETVIAINFGKRIILIGGSYYAGEMKKSVFTTLNYYLPAESVMPMHCSANVGPGGDVALFFGLSGTGKTTLSADPQRTLIGDDEHGWGPHGVFNFEGGCYAKCIKLSQKNEPQIWNSLRFGAVLENVIMDHKRHADYDSDKLTENTRANYPVEFIDGAVIPSVGGHPKVVVFLTADAFGVLPPLARLTPEQAMFHFLSGYTAKVAGTEVGVKDPEPTFSACFGGPFLVWHPTKYAELLAEKLRKHGAQTWLVNTGWSGGGFGVGKRMSLKHTRAIIDAI
ncbi:MAG: phosphoenolpyruvate carboxykinase (ATP), partial [Xanthobacteraceae bacterium]